MKKKIIVFIGATVLSLSASFFTPSNAEAAWSSYSTTTLNSSDGFVRTGTYAGKFSERTTWRAEASEKTMWSNPVKRLINSSNEVRGNNITLSSTNTVYTASTINALVGYNYYAQIRPAWNQVGQDTIRSRHSPDPE